MFKILNLFLCFYSINKKQKKIFMFMSSMTSKIQEDLEENLWEAGEKWKLTLQERIMTILRTCDRTLKSLENSSGKSKQGRFP